MAPRDAGRPSVTNADPRLVTYGVAAIVGGFLIAWLVDQPLVRFAGSVTAIVVGIGLLRQAIRVE
jgi:hypothetical protein